MGLCNKDSSAKKIHKWEKKLPEIAEKTTRMEKISDEAERDVLQMICAGYIEQHIGDEYEGIITGISQGCMTVLLDNYIEGTIRVKGMNGDYVYSPDSFSLVSLEDRNNYYIGDRLRLKLKSSSAETLISGLGSSFGTRVGFPTGFTKSFFNNLLKFALPSSFVIAVIPRTFLS